MGTGSTQDTPPATPQHKPLEGRRNCGPGRTQSPARTLQLALPPPGSPAVPALRRQQEQGPEGGGPVGNWPVARALGRADEEQLCVPGRHWERKGLGWWQRAWPSDGRLGLPSSPHVLLPTYAHSQPEGHQDTPSPYSCMATDKWPPLSEPREHQRLPFPRHGMWGRNPTCLEHLLGACPRVT